MNVLSRWLLVLFLSGSFAFAAEKPATPKHPEKSAATNAAPRVRLITDMGVIVLTLDAAKAPATVKNFLQYVDSGFYNGTIFHRVMPHFMIQGGGFTPGMHQKPTRQPVINEADNGLKNLAGTVAMARTSDPQSAAAQFFINTVDNSFLDFTDKTQAGWGYAVFGKVSEGMDVVKKIEAVATTRVGPHENVPTQDVVIVKAERITR